jgi:hypothetical protein
MTRQQFIEEIKQLSVTERIALIEAITRSVREELEAHGETTPSARPESEQVEGQDKLRISQRLRGILKFEGEPPTDEEVKDMYADYLSEKYS